jgi:hypothetical protein
MGARSELLFLQKYHRKGNKARDATRKEKNKSIKNFNYTMHNVLQNVIENVLFKTYFKVP